MATASTETAWQVHYAARPALADRLTNAAHGAAPGLGLTGPQLELMVDVFLDVVSTEPALCAELAATWQAAAAAQAAADAEALAAQPYAEGVAGDSDSLLDKLNAEDCRTWLKTAHPQYDVNWQLNLIGDETHRRAWARRLLEWARADGTRYDVMAVLQSHAPAAPDRPVGDSVLAPAAEAEPAVTAAPDSPDGTSPELTV